MSASIGALPSLTMTGGSFHSFCNVTISNLLLGAFDTPAEFAALCAFVCSAQASYLKGPNLLPDGGRVQGRIDRVARPGATWSGLSTGAGQSGVVLGSL